MQGERLRDKVAIVTGGASGIGAETARVFAAQGARVVLCDVQDELGRAVAKEIADAGGAAEYRTLDVGREEQWAALVAATEQKYGRIDVLANIAGISGRPPGMTVQPGNIAGMALVEQTLESWNRVMEVNATGVFLGTKAVIPAMQRAGGGSIINISSICGLIGSWANAAYHASKGAVRLMTKSIALHCAHRRYGIRCNSVHPTFIETPMVDGMLQASRDPAHMRAALLAQVPLGRFGRAEEIADLLVYLVSDESQFVTGAEFVIDGGLTAS